MDFDFSNMSLSDANNLLKQINRKIDFFMEIRKMTELKLFSSKDKDINELLDEINYRLDKSMMQRGILSKKINAIEENIMLE